MQTPLRRILTGVVFFVLTLIGAVMGYILAGWSVLDSIYMVVITIFGVGYGEVQPITTPHLRVFTMLVIVAGTSSAVYAVGGFFQLVTEGEIKRVLGARRMAREIGELQNHVIICGFGRMGQILARRMAEVGEAFVVVDSDGDRIQEAELNEYLICPGDATDETVLTAAGIHRARALSTVLPNDAANVFITLTARGMNPNLTILARGEKPSTEKKLLQAGADRVVLPATIGAMRMAHLIRHPISADLLDVSDGVTHLNELLAQVEVKIDEIRIDPSSELLGSSVGSVEVKGQGAFIIVALRRGTGEMIVHPGQDVFLHEGDTLIVLGHRGDLPKFARVNRRQRLYRGARF